MITDLESSVHVKLVPLKGDSRERIKLHATIILIIGSVDKEFLILVENNNINGQFINCMYTILIGTCTIRQNWVSLMIM